MNKEIQINRIMDSTLEKRAHIFDDTFRTLEEKHLKIMVPMINEVFHTEYAMEEAVLLLSDSHHPLVVTDSEKVAPHIESQKKEKERTALERTQRETDSLIKIRNKLYHLECESNPDGTMVFRMIEYDFAIALDRALREGLREVKFPQSAVLYLRGPKKKKLTLDLLFPQGEKVAYEVPVIHLQDYTKERIVEKKLYVLIPFFILQYEKELKEQATLQHPAYVPEDFEDTYQYFLQALLNAGERCELTSYDFCNIVQYTKDLINYVAANNYAVKEKAVNIMGGQVMITPADRLISEGEKRGEQLGIQKGTVEMCKEFGMSLSETIEKVAQKFALSPQEAEEVVQQYWN